MVAMAIINCPRCGKRISDLSKVCAHCSLPLGEMSEHDIEQLERQRWRKRIYIARNVTYLGMTALVVGAIWWFMVGTGGLVLPPPPLSVVLLALGVVVYLGGRGWLLWLRMKRNRPH